jgi:hypothetical protein
VDEGEHSVAGREGELEARLYAVTEEVTELRRRKFHPREGEPDLTPAEEERLWRFVVEWLDLFAAIVDQSAGIDDGGRPPPQAEVMRLAAEGIQQALDGFLPRTWQGKQQQSLSAMERDAVLITASYYELIREGLFDDDKRAAFLAAAFGVTPRMIQIWAKEPLDPEKHAFWRAEASKASGSDGQELRDLRREIVRRHVRYTARLRRQRLL